VQLSNTDRSIRCTTACPSVITSLVVGRDEILRQIKQRLMQGQPGGDVASRVAIHGWPGVGKSTVAAALAHDGEILNHFRDGALWVSLGQQPEQLPKLEAWCRALGMQETSRAMSAEEASGLLSALLQHQRRLLVVDDVWKEDDAIPFLVGGRLCGTLITTRLAAVAERLAPTRDDARNLEVLDVEFAVELLGRHAPEVVASHSDEAQQLVEALERLPLAIEVAGRLLNTHCKRWEAAGRSSVRRLLEELTDAARLLEEQAPASMLGLLGETKPTIAALLQKSTDYLDDETRDRFTYLSAFAPKPATFSLKIMARTWSLDEKEARRVANRLIDHGLLEPIGNGRFWVHALVVSFAETLVDEE